MRNGREDERKAMVERQIRARGVSDENVLKAMRTVPRHLFVPDSREHLAYQDHPLPIGEGQTISQPYIVAYMTEQLGIGPGSRVLEIGLGSGYQAAVLSRVAKEVYSVELVESLARRAESVLTDLGYDNIHVRIGDGYSGWSEKAPFDAIMVTAAPAEVPGELVKQLGKKGVMVLPVGTSFQELVRIDNTEDGPVQRPLMAVSFVPMVRT